MSTSGKAVSKPERNPNGTLKKGHTANPGGRQALPDLYTALTPVGLAVQAALATGVVVEDLIPEGLSPEQRKAALEAIQNAALAGTLDPDLRGKHAEMMISRRHGKPKEQVEVTGADGGPIERMVIEVRRAPPDPKVIEGVTAKKTLPTRDAE